MNPRLRIEALNEHHDRGAFFCGEDALDRYIRTQATQDNRRRIVNCFVAIDADGSKIARSPQSPPAVFALLVDAKNDEAIAFYRRFGFVSYLDQSRTMFLPMATAEKTLL